MTRYRVIFSIKSFLLSSYICILSKPASKRSSKSSKITSNIFWDSALLIPSSFTITSCIGTSLIVQGVWEPRMYHDRGTLQFLDPGKPSKNPTATSLPKFSKSLLSTRWTSCLNRKINIVELAHKKE